MAAETLQDALNIAAEESGLSDETPIADKGKPIEDDVDQDKGKSNPADSDEDDDEDDAAELAQQKVETDNAVKFYRAITNPETAEQVLSNIAKKAGYKLENLTPPQRKAIASGIEEALREEMGDEYSLLPANFATGIEKAVSLHSKNLQSKIEDLEARLTDRDQREHQSATDQAIKWASETLTDFDTPQMQKRVLREMRDLPPSSGTDLRKYIVKMYKLAGGTVESNSQEVRNSRTKQNLDGRKPSDDVRGERSTKVINTLADAAKAAYEEQFPNE